MSSTQPIAQKTCWENYVANVNATCSWLGRQVSSAGSTVKTWAVKAYDVAMKFFAQVCAYVSKAATATAQFIKTNSQQIGIALGGLAAALGLVWLYQNCCAAQPNA